MSDLIFSGTYPCTVDDRGRLAIPKSMRIQVPNSQEKYWVTIMIPERCVAVYPHEQWKAAYEHLRSECATNSPADRERLRTILEMTYAVRPDTQGRFRVHPALVRAAGLQGRLLAIGSGDHVEYWSLEHRQKYARSTGLMDAEVYATYEESEGGEGDEGGDT